MANKYQVDHRNMLLGCSLIALIVLIGLMALSVFVFRQERQAARYPGAARISSHANYKSLPREFRWDDAYRTADPFPAVYNWYSNGFNLGPERRANGSCILLEGLTSRLALERYMGVMLCDTPRGRMIFVSRSVSLR
jgi:hypothetical protein